MESDFFLDKKCELDNLTGVYRRSVILSYMDYLVDNKIPFSFMILDIDNFKQYNDNYGHLVGDIVLKTVSSSLHNIISDKGVIGRYGGDEFIFVFPEVVEYDDVWQEAFVMLKSTNDLKIEGYDDIKVTYSLGISRYPKDSTIIDELITTADKALYRGKIKGRNCFIVFLPEKHGDIKLQAMREKFFSPVSLQEKIYNMLTKKAKINDNIKNVIDFIGTYLLIDHLCVETDNKLLFTYNHPLSPKKEFFPYTDDLITRVIQSNGLYVENTTLLNQNDDLSKLMIKNDIYGCALFKIKAFNKFYGYLRADITIVDTGRIWQTDDLVLLQSLANYIGLILYSKKKDFNN